jgi:hypothetical protein
MGRRLQSGCEENSETKDEEEETSYLCVGSPEVSSGFGDGSRSHGGREYAAVPEFEYRWACDRRMMILLVVVESFFPDSFNEERVDTG